MKNIEKAELRKDVRELSKQGYKQKEALKILTEWGYCYSTARMYWKIFSQINIDEINNGNKNI